MKNSTILFVVVSLVAVLLLVSGCQTQTAFEPIEEKVAMPLKIGNRWTFQSMFFFIDIGSNQVITDTTIEEDVISGDTLINNERWFFYFAVGSKTIMRNGPGGLWLMNRQTIDSVPAPELRYKYPAQKGDTTWFSGYDTPGYIVVASIDTTIAVPAGTFSCYYFYTPQQRFTSASGQGSYFSKRRMFISPGVGIVKLEVYRFSYTDEPTQLAWSIELASYQLK